MSVSVLVINSYIMRAKIDVEAKHSTFKRITLNH